MARRRWSARPSAPLDGGGEPVGTSPDRTHRTHQTDQTDQTDRTEHTTSNGQKAPRAETFDDVLERLSPLERLNVRMIRSSFESPWMNNLLRAGQRYIGAGWIYLCTKNLVQLVGLERLPPPEEAKGLIWASNHRSFFDMYVANAYLFRHGYHERVLYPVRSGFFYDHPLGFLVNGIMSFWSMYPPVFRDRKRAALNHTAFSELAAAIRSGRSVGIHPEGTRNRGDDPYALLPPQSGVGRLIHLARAPVIPIFINGLGNNLVRQVQGNFNGKGEPVVVVFGGAVDLGDLLEQPGTGKIYRDIAERVMGAIAALGEEERSLRARARDAAQPLPRR